jgi:hypothetical protein
MEQPPIIILKGSVKVTKIDPIQKNIELLIYVKCSLQCLLTQAGKEFSLKVANSACRYLSDEGFLIQNGPSPWHTRVGHVTV